MKKSKLKKLIICVISILIISLVVFNYTGVKLYAADTSGFEGVDDEDAGDIDTDDEFGDEDDEDDEFGDEDEEEARKKAEEEAAAKKKAEEEAAKKKAEEAAKQKTYDAKKDDGIPNAGLDNSGIFVIIAVSSISAIFAYRKFKEYKNI